MSAPPSRPPMSTGRIALVSGGALALGAYIFSRSRFRSGRLIQPEEQAQYQGKGQTDAGTEKRARSKGIERSGEISKP
ncbi:hypothetical protein VTO42DRAFT_2862 [Malbranchea cinnamomea]